MHTILSFIPEEFYFYILKLCLASQADYSYIPCNGEQWEFVCFIANFKAKLSIFNHSICLMYDFLFFACLIVFLNQIKKLLSESLRCFWVTMSLQSVCWDVMSLQSECWDVHVTAVGVLSEIPMWPQPVRFLHV